MRAQIFTPGPGRSTVGTLVYLLIGPVIWAAHFMTVYAAQGWLCAIGAAQDRIIAAVFALTLPPLLALAAALFMPAGLARLLRASDWGEETQHFLAGAMRLLSLLSLLAVLYFATAAALLPACPALR